MFQILFFLLHALFMEAPDEIPVTEQTPQKPAESPYGATKQMGEEIVREITKNRRSAKYSVEIF